MAEAPTLLCQSPINKEAVRSLLWDIQEWPGLITSELTKGEPSRGELTTSEVTTGDVITRGVTKGENNNNNRGKKVGSNNR